MDCIFCKIVQGQIPATFVYEDETVVAFTDLNPQAPTHILVIPREHLGSLAEVKEEDAPMLGHLQMAAAKVARLAGLGGGYRTVINTGHDGGQTVMHLHIHVLGGRQMHWPPG
jgi:histidine triad (HIT) family protein